jgi:hypothetical protein
MHNVSKKKTAIFITAISLVASSAILPMDNEDMSKFMPSKDDLDYLVAECQQAFRHYGAFNPEKQKELEKRCMESKLLRKTLWCARHATSYEKTNACMGHHNIAKNYVEAQQNKPASLIKTDYDMPELPDSEKETKEKVDKLVSECREACKPSGTYDSEKEKACVKRCVKRTLIWSLSACAGSGTRSDWDSRQDLIAQCTWNHEAAKEYANAQLSKQ